MMLISGIKKEHAVWNKKTQLELNSNSVTTRVTLGLILNSSVKL